MSTTNISPEDAFAALMDGTIPTDKPKAIPIQQSPIVSSAAQSQLDVLEGKTPTPEHAPIAFDMGLVAASADAAQTTEVVELPAHVVHTEAPTTESPQEIVANEQGAYQHEPIEIELATSIAADELDDLDQIEEPAEASIESLPILVFDPDNAPRMTLELYSKFCFDCDSFNPEGKLIGRSRKCHMSRGNERCPGKYIACVLTGKRDKLLDKLIEAKKTGDGVSLFAAMQAVMSDDIDIATREWVLKSANMFQNT